MKTKSKVRRPVLRDALFYAFLVVGTVAAAAWMKVAVDLGGGQGR
jgi:hypothetical protein